ncbi:MAG: glycosyltransferase, partial [Hyphomonas sp.]|nr:glycosyltransferase [Hyphomonas sp.]
MNPNWRSRIALLGIIDDGGTTLHQELPDAARSLAFKIIKNNSLNVSVIMPTWNRVDVIDKAIESVLAQVFRPHELVIVDDGSTDGTLEYLHESYPDLIKNGFMKLVEGPRAGVSHARNLGMEASSGDLIAYLDSDNSWRPDFLFVMVALFESCDELHTAYAGLAGIDAIEDRSFVRASRYDRRRLLDGNFIDLNVFVHRRQLFRQFGGFDTDLKRLVDWDLIIRYTRLYEPAYVPLVGVDYFIGDGLDNITKTVPLEENRNRVLRKHSGERLRMGLETLRLAYIVYDFPALSQTFVTNEVRWLVENGVDVVAYHMIDPDKSADLDFPIRKVRVSSAEELTECLIRDDRNLCHSHFVYPTITNFVWPACEEIGIPFTVFPHAVDLFHESNVKRNRIDELAKSEQCLKIFVYGDHHRNFLIERGVPQHKIAYNFQVPGLREQGKERARHLPRAAGAKKRGLVIARFIEKKGISFLIDAIAQLDPEYREKLLFDIYGYGPEEAQYVQSIEAFGLQGIVKLRGPIESAEALHKAYETADFLCAPCVVAKNGDRDGFPTVILDAINEGIPVVTTAVSGIPDYLSDGIQAIVVESKNAAACAEGLKRLIDMSPQQTSAMIHRAHQFASSKVNLENTVKVYLDHWLNRPVDLFMVTYNTEKYEDSLSTLEIIRRVGEHTTTPYTLTIVDNDSDAEFKQQLLESVTDDPNIRLILKDDNLLCGPASNIAVNFGDAKYAIYICSKEGFILRHGWERPLMQFMEQNGNVAQAGHLCHLPRATYGYELENIEEFPKFRNTDFARRNRHRPFKHVQGGCYIVRRDVFLSVGGFNNDIPQNNMDVEFSYMLESEGWEIAKIPDMISLSIKTLPNLGAHINERTPIVHPSNFHECTSELDVWQSSITLRRCNICGWTGE